MIPNRYNSIPEMSDGDQRKNTTRESTNMLKSWLQEHNKNPYPSKGEKIMLAIVTKMTCTRFLWFESNNMPTTSFFDLYHKSTSH